jgi:hypothetical protein
LKCTQGSLWATAPNHCYEDPNRKDVTNSSTGAFDFESPEEHAFDPALSAALVDFLTAEHARDAVDLGCGNCAYVAALREAGIDAHGVDANVHTPQVTRGLGAVADLTELLPTERIYDWVICLEVGEHIPMEHECTLFQNIHNLNSKGVILSWATLNQGGNGHVNCRSNEYVKEIMKCLAYSNDENAELDLRRSASLDWFWRTLMLFRKCSPACHRHIVKENKAAIERLRLSNTRMRTSLLLCLVLVGLLLLTLSTHALRRDISAVNGRK